MFIYTHTPDRDRNRLGQSSRIYIYIYIRAGVHDRVVFLAAIETYARHACETGTSIAARHVYRNETSRAPLISSNNSHRSIRPNLRLGPYVSIATEPSNLFDRFNSRGLRLPADHVQYYYVRVDGIGEISYRPTYGRQPRALASCFFLKKKIRSTQLTMADFHPRSFVSSTPPDRCPQLRDGRCTTM
jgi:hypothetical protein